MMGEPNDDSAASTARMMSMMMQMMAAQAAAAAGGGDSSSSLLEPSESPRCGNPRCSSRRQPIVSPAVLASLKACSACNMLSYCGKDCQKADWKRHKAVCVICRPYVIHIKQQLTDEQKNVLDDYQMIQLPNIVDEYRHQFPGEVAHCTWIEQGLEQLKEKMSLRHLYSLQWSRQDSLRRWRATGPKVEAFMDTATFGDIFEDKEYRRYVPGTAPQQFRHTPMVRPTTLRNGGTIVDIGFVDFGIVFDSIPSLELGGLPLTVVGFDAEPQCVAKSMIMIDMMKDVKVRPRSIIEVWLSSLWSVETVRAFQRATKRILNVNTNLPVEVKRIIEFWNAANHISSNYALDVQFQGIRTKTAESEDVPYLTMSRCCSLQLQSDRVAYLRYFFTKAWYEDDTTTMGSLVMNLTDETVGIQQLYDDGLEAIPDYLYQRDDNSHFSPGNSFMGRAKIYVEQRMETFMAHVRVGSLNFAPKLGVISLAKSGEKLLTQIRTMNPYLVSWGNVVDYFSPDDFHEVARKLSGTKTVHSFHSCHWTTTLYGTDIWDLNRIDRLRHYGTGLLLMHAGLSDYDFLVTLAPYHCREVSCTILAEQLVNKYFQHFFENDRVRAGCSTGATPLSITAFPFNRCITTAHICFSYWNANLDFGHNNYDYTTRLHWSITRPLPEDRRQGR